MQAGGAIYMEKWATMTWNSFSTFSDNLARDVSSTERHVSRVGIPLFDAQLGHRGAESTFACT